MKAISIIIFVAYFFKKFFAHILCRNSIAEGIFSFVKLFYIVCASIFSRSSSAKEETIPTIAYVIVSEITELAISEIFDLINDFKFALYRYYAGISLLVSALLAAFSL